MSEPLISCLCVTNRLDFEPWLRWNFDKQTWPASQRELVIVDGAGDVGAKRAKALALAKGSYVAWFDDDDWQHPRRLEDSMSMVARGAVLAVGARRGYFVDAARLACSPFLIAPPRRVIFNSVLCHVDVARATTTALLPMDEAPAVVREQAWADSVAHMVPTAVVEWLPFFWVIHGRNWRNSSVVRPCRDPLEILAPLVPDWTETVERLRSLKCEPVQDGP